MKKKHLLKYYNLERKRFLKYSIVNKTSKDKDYILTMLSILTHDIEKGLSLKNPRKSFGRKKVEEIMDLLDKASAYELNNEIVLNAKDILKTYIILKDTYEFDIKDCIKYINNSTDSTKTGYEEKKAVDCSKKDFLAFAMHRHSIRYFMKRDIKNDVLYNVLKLAQSAPSACNRQSISVCAIKNQKKVKDILNMHGGAKGFEDVSVLFLIKSDLSKYTCSRECATPYVDGGIFAMNLLYSLQYYGLGSCPLIWDDNGRMNEIREIVDIAENEVVVCLIAAGYFPEEYRYAKSKRKDISEILEIID